MNTGDPITEASIDREIRQSAHLLAMALQEAADQLRAVATPSPEDNTRPDIAMALEAVKAARAGLGLSGDDLIALSVLRGLSMEAAARLVGLAASTIPVRLARTARLGRYATKSAQPRVGSKEIGAALWDFRLHRSPNQDIQGYHPQ